MVTLNRHQFAQQLNMDLSNDYGESLLNAFHPEHGHVGQMSWDPDNRMVEGLYVDASHRRKGVATAMWDYAQQHGKPRPIHSPSRTKEGDAWAQSVGAKPVSRHVTY